MFHSSGLDPDSEETTSLISKVLSSAIEEIQMIFSRASALKQYEKLGMLKIREKADKGVPVRILIGTDSPVNLRDLERLVGIPRLELRYLLKSIKTKLTTIVTDRELSLVIEEKKMKMNQIWVWRPTQTVNQPFYLMPLYLRTYGHNQLVKVSNDEPSYQIKTDKQITSSTSQQRQFEIFAHRLGPFMVGRIKELGSFLKR